MKTIALFNNKGGVGKTTLVYHLAHAFPRLGYRVLAVDLDPQANLTAAFFDEETLEGVWDEAVFGKTILKCVEPILEGTGDIAPPEPLEVASGLSVLCGDLGLSRFEDRLADSWPRGFNNDPAALRNTSAFHRIIRQANASAKADVALIDVGPNLGAINRAALLAAEYLIVPLAADLFSLQGLENLGPAVQQWRTDWKLVVERANVKFDLPAGSMRPAGYVVLQHAIRLDRPAKWYDRWLQKIPALYAEAVLGNARQDRLSEDHCLATLRDYRTLMQMAQEARKPMFDLKAADGAIGSHAQLVQACWKDFANLCRQIATACGIHQQP